MRNLPAIMNQYAQIKLTIRDKNAWLKQTTKKMLQKERESKMRRTAYSSSK
jgi:hypothetical protein